MASRRVLLLLAVTAVTVRITQQNIFGGVPVFDEDVITDEAADGETHIEEAVEYDYDEYDDMALNGSSSEERTLRLLKPLRNMTLRAGETLKLRCEFAGDPPPTRFIWYRNEAPLERGEAQMKKAHRTRNGWRMRLRIGEVDTHDTGYYKCRAYNGRHKAESTAIVVVNRAEGDGVSDNRARDSMTAMDVPAFPPAKPIFDFPNLNPGGDAHLEGLDVPPNAGQFLPAHLPPTHSLKPPESPLLAVGSCQPYRGLG